MLFSALITVKRPGQALATAFRTEIGFWLVFYRLAAAGTEFGIGRQVFPTGPANRPCSFTSKPIHHNASSGTSSIARLPCSFNRSPGVTLSGRRRSPSKGDYGRVARRRVTSSHTQPPLSPLRTMASMTSMFATASSRGVGTGLSLSTAWEKRSPWMVY